MAHITKREAAAVRAVNAATKGLYGMTGGQCYIASLALYRLLGGKRDYHVVGVDTKHGAHYFVERSKTRRSLDPTADQYSGAVALYQHKAQRFIVRNLRAGDLDTKGPRDIHDAAKKLLGA